MRRVIEKIRRFLIKEDGPTAVEYAVMLAMIIMVCIVAVKAIGLATTASFTDTAAELPG